MTHLLKTGEAFSALIFDVDGLMIESERVERGAWQAAALEFDRTITDAEFAEIIGVSRSTAKHILIGHWSERSENEIAFDKIYERKVKISATMPIERRPGLDPLLSWARSIPIPMAIASSTKRPLMMSRLRRANIDPMQFDVIVGGDDVRKVKPAPDIYLLAACKLGIPPASCLVLEDSDDGIRAAHAAGAISFFIPDLSLRLDAPIPVDVIDAAHIELNSLYEVEAYFRRNLEY